MPQPGSETYPGDEQYPGGLELARGGYVYRPLALVEPRLVGWDVWALQSALKVKRDGRFGAQTELAVLTFQAAHKGLTADGVAGPTTQKEICRVALVPLRREYGLPKGLPTGQVKQESAFLLGNHTAPRDDGSRDCGVCQRNTKYATLEQAFDVPDSLELFCRHVAEHYVTYSDIGVVGERRAWELAAGSWNAPAWTDRLARGETLSPTQLSHIEAYIRAVCQRVLW